MLTIIAAYAVRLATYEQTHIHVGFLIVIYINTIYINSLNDNLHLYFL